jgi:hypothetical protein
MPEMPLCISSIKTFSPGESRREEVPTFSQPQFFSIPWNGSRAVQQSKILEVTYGAH